METNSLPIKRSLTVFYGFVVSVLLLIADYFSGPFIQFPISYLIPVAFLSWFNGRHCIWVDPTNYSLTSIGLGYFSSRCQPSKPSA